MDRKLYEAAASGDIIFLQKITDLKLDPDHITSQQENNVLHIAVHFKQLEFSKQVLILYPSLLLKSNAKGESPLHVAAKIGCLEIAEHLVNSAKTLHQDVESRVIDAQKKMLRMVNQEKDTALHVAVRKGHLAISKLLMEADPGLLELVNSINTSPLYLAVDGKFSNIANCILEFSPVSHFGGPRGTTALHSAVLREQHDVVEVLLQKRPDMIKEVDIHGWTPLCFAALTGDLKTTQLLLQCNSSTAYLLDKDGTSALHVAAFKGHILIVEEIIQYCPDIAELIDKKGHTALHVAIISGQKEMVRYILKMPKLASIINEQDEDGNTALHLAVIHKRVNITKYLALDRRVEKTVMNKEFLTAYDILLSRIEMPSYSDAKTHYFLRGTKGIPYMLQFIDNFEKKKMMGEAREQEKSDLGAAKENFEETTRSMLEIHLLVAMLIATVTFQAAFNMPGGYIDNGDDTGKATFIGNAWFKAFIISNTTAFYFSIATVIIHFATSKLNYSSRTKYTHLAVEFIYIALCAMVIAFVSGVYLVLMQSIGLAITPCIMVASFLLGYRVFVILDPAGNCSQRFNRARENFRNLLFRYGII